MAIVVKTRFLALFAVILFALAGGTDAQTAFAPVARVNDGVVTQYDIDQRQRLLRALNAPAELQAEALDRLIDERLQIDAAARVGVEVSEEELVAGMEEFAARGNLPLDRFFQLLAGAGVDEQAFRDFVRAGLAWREAVQTRFGPQVQISPDDVARAREEVRPDAGLRVLLSEIILPAETAQAQAEARARAEELRRITGLEAFAAAAREFSAAPTSDVGGRVDWIPVDELPVQVAAEVIRLRPGQVTRPIPIPGAIALFQLRALEETEAAAGDVTVDYAQFLIPGIGTGRAQAQAAEVRARVDTCDDLYAVARGLPADRLLRDERPVSQVPQDIALQLARLDPTEVSTVLRRGDFLVFLMLCDRGRSGELAIEEPAIVNRLRGERLNALAASWLAELRTEAFIERIGG